MDSEKSGARVIDTTAAEAAGAEEQKLINRCAFAGAAIFCVLNLLTGGVVPGGFIGGGIGGGLGAVVGLLISSARKTA